MSAARAVLARALPARALPARPVAVLLAVLTLLGVLSGPAVAAPPDVRRHAVTAAQERVVLRLIDDVCGDTWCEGDHRMRFRAFTCHPRRGCVLRMQLAPWSAEPVRWRTRSARVPGFPRFGDMVVTAPEGGRSLRPAFFEAVGRAVRAMADSVPSP